MSLSSQFAQDISDYNEAMIKNKTDCRLTDPSKLSAVIELMKRVYSRKSILFCVDVEAWEKNTRHITEVGVSIYDPRGQEYALVPNIKTIHYIIEENIYKKNGAYVPEHSMNFSGSASYVASKQTVCRVLQHLIDNYFCDQSFPCLLVGHDVGGDISWLRSMSVEFPYVFDRLDTQTLFAYSYGKSGSSLKNALRTVNQPFAFLHNAGNDAYYTVMLALKLCDPSVRSLLNFDVIPPNEDREGPRRYPKVENNRSEIKYIK